MVLLVCGSLEGMQTPRFKPIDDGISTGMTFYSGRRSPFPQVNSMLELYIARSFLGSCIFFVR